MVSVKQLAMERMRSTREKSLNGLLTSAGLRAIGKSLCLNPKPYFDSSLVSFWFFPSYNPTSTPLWSHFSFAPLNGFHIYTIQL